MDQRQRTIIVLRLWLKVLLAGFAYLLVITFTSLRIPCWFYQITGYQCPGCGVTRMVYALAHLRLREAWAANPYFLCMLPLLILYFFYRSRRYIIGSGDHYSKTEKVLLWLALAGAVIFGIVRNLP